MTGISCLFWLSMAVLWPQSPNAFDVADLSFLIPPSTASIPVAGGGSGTPLLTEGIFNQFEDFVKRGHPNVTRPYDKLIVTGLRFDPCGPVYPVDWNLAGCFLPNVRVIAQVFENGRTADAALHIVFALGVKTDQDRMALQMGSGFDASVREAAFGELRAMKLRNEAAGISTAGAPVGVHPAFLPAHAATDRSPAFAAELAALLRRVAAEGNYFATAVMFAERSSGSQARSQKERWVWQKGNVVRQSTPPGVRIVLGGIPGFSPTLKEQTFSADVESRDGAEITPRPTIQNGSSSNAAIMDALRTESSFDWGGLQTVVDLLDTLENPDRVLVQTDDCVSCHLSTTVRLYLLRDRRLSWVKRRMAFSFDAKAAGLAGSISPEDTQWQAGAGYRVMSLGFFKGRPSVSQRTVNETLQAARVLNSTRR